MSRPASCQASETSLPPDPPPHAVRPAVAGVAEPQQAAEQRHGQGGGIEGDRVEHGEMANPLAWAGRV
jgi:hypothetical protein